MAIRQFNARPRPRCLAIGFFGTQLSRLEATLPGIRSINSISDVHQADWDLLICNGGDLRDVSPNLFVVAFGGLLLDKARAVGGSAVIVRQDAFEDEGERRRPVSVAVEFSTPDVVPVRFEALISSDLVRIATAEHWHSTLLTYHPTDGGIGEPSHDIDGVERLLVGSDGAAYAAHFRRAGGKAWCLTLPDEADLVAWVEAAVNHWHTLDTKRFPGTLDWSNQAWDWLTPDEIDAANAVVEAMEEKKRIEGLEEAAMQRFNQARASARSGPFRLLTEQGTELANAVRDVLRDVGLVVRDMDQEVTDRDAAEDLRVSPPDRLEWVALAEVKGYTRSQGKAEDLLNLTGRFGLRYRRAEGRDADAYWYIVNHHFGTDPVARKTVLEGSDRDLDAFGAVGGLAIDTVDLFRLWRDVARNRLEPEAARALLVGATGRFAYEASTVDDPKS